MMTGKLDPYKTSGEKLIGLFSLLLFTEREFSLTQLAETFKCSRQTVLRIIEQIERAQHVTIESRKEGGQRYFRARSPRKDANIALAAGEIRSLLLCRDIVMHILPENVRTEVSHSIAKASMLIPDPAQRAEALRPFAFSVPKGSIDYGPFAETLQQLFDAIRQHRICIIQYKPPTRPEPSTLTVAPYAVTAFNDGLYLRARLKKALTDRGEYFDPILAVHRMEQVAVTGETFAPITDGSTANGNHFGLYAGQPFRVVADIAPTAAAYIRERTWSSDQEIAEHADGSLTLRFTATSEPEVVAWLFSFGDEAHLREPAHLRQQMHEELLRTVALYGDCIPEEAIQKKEIPGC